MIVEKTITLFNVAPCIHSKSALPNRASSHGNICLVDFKTVKRGPFLKTLCCNFMAIKAKNTESTIGQGEEQPSLLSQRFPCVFQTLKIPGFETDLKSTKRSCMVRHHKVELAIHYKGETEDRKSELRMETAAE